MRLLSRPVGVLLNDLFNFIIVVTDLNGQMVEGGDYGTENSSGV